MVSGKTVAIAALAVAVGVGGGILIYSRYKPSGGVLVARGTPAVTATWGTPRAVAGVKDSLGLTVFPEMYEENRLDKQDACAWQGCIGELDPNGRCTGCPQM